MKVVILQEGLYLNVQLKSDFCKEGQIVEVLGWYGNQLIEDTLAVSEEVYKSMLEGKKEQEPDKDLTTQKFDKKEVEEVIKKGRPRK